MEISNNVWGIVNYLILTVTTQLTPHQKYYQLSKQEIEFHLKQDRVVNSSGSKTVNFCHTEGCCTKKWGRISPETHW